MPCIRGIVLGQVLQSFIDSELFHSSKTCKGRFAWAASKAAIEDGKKEPLAASPQSSKSALTSCLQGFHRKEAPKVKFPIFSRKVTSNKSGTEVEGFTASWQAQQIVQWLNSHPKLQPFAGTAVTALTCTRIGRTLRLARSGWLNSMLERHGARWRDGVLKSEQGRLRTAQPNARTK